MNLDDLKVKCFYGLMILNSCSPDNDAFSEVVGMAGRDTWVEWVFDGYSLALFWPVFLLLHDLSECEELLSDCQSYIQSHRNHVLHSLLAWIKKKPEQKVKKQKQAKKQPLCI